MTVITIWWLSSLNHFLYIISFVLNLISLIIHGICIWISLLFSLTSLFSLDIIAFELYSNSDFFFMSIMMLFWYFQYWIQTYNCQNKTCNYITYLWWFFTQSGQGLKIHSHTGLRIRQDTMTSCEHIDGSWLMIFIYLICMHMTWFSSGHSTTIMTFSINSVCMTHFSQSFSYLRINVSQMMSWIHAYQMCLGNI